MWRLAAPLALALLVAACAPTAQERVQGFADDGRHLYRRGAYGEAGEQFKAALLLRPEDPDLLCNLARCQEQLGRRDEADQLYISALRHQPNHPEARHAVVARHVEAGRREEAGKMVQGWLRSNPRLAAPYVEDGWLLAGDGDLDSARGRFLQALEIEPRNVRAMNELAKLFEKIGHRERAVVLYERSLEADPDQPAIRKRMEELRAQGVGRPRPD
jgi:Tfp pilus assembly protein PilF